MSDRPHLRLVVLRVLVVTVLATLLGRLWYLQVYAGARYTKAAQDNRIREIVEPAKRGMIYDSSGRVLVESRTVMVVSVNRSVLRRQRDHGTAVLNRLGRVVGLTEADLGRLVTPCGDRYPDGTRARSPDCWNGSPYQPVPVRTYSADDPRQTQPALRILEHREDFPGVTAELQPVRFYPHGSLAAHLLGYLGAIRGDEGKDPRYAGLPTARVGRSGVEQVYDEALRGTVGRQELLVDKDGNVTGEQNSVPPRAGDALVLSLDARVQKLAEDALQRGMLRARATLDKKRNVTYRAPTGAVVVLEARTGRVVAMASNPSYDPTIFTRDRLSPRSYRALTDPAHGAPLYSNATQGTFAPGSTFKLVSTAAAVAAGNGIHGYYPCPTALRVGDHLFANFEGETYGTIDFRTTLIKSCDTVYYKLAYDEWLRDGGTSNRRHPREIFPRMAQAFGFGRPTGVDLPSEAAGQITSRTSRLADYRTHRRDYCTGARNPRFSDYRRAIDAENCTDGMTYRAGDAVLLAIGQGDVAATPLQLASAYAALANGGTLYAPRVAKALLSADGSRVTPLPPRIVRRLPVPADVLSYVRAALTGVTAPGGTAQAAYAGLPTGLVAGKTGTADVHGKQPTSWFASFAPAAAPRYVVVAMVTEGGTGGTTAAPITREIYDGLFGWEGHRSVLSRGMLPATLPVVRSDGTVAPPVGQLGRPRPAPGMPSPLAMVNLPATAPPRRDGP